jgi:hypothetical protein
MFVIEDELHAELHGSFDTLDAAVAELRRRAAIPWDQDPNRAPCTSWRTCGRDYLIREYQGVGRKDLIRRIEYLRVTAAGPEWNLVADSNVAESDDEAAIRARFERIGYEVEVQDGDGHVWLNLRRGDSLIPRYVVEKDRASAFGRALERYLDEPGSLGPSA